MLYRLLRYPLARTYDTERANRSRFTWGADTFADAAVNGWRLTPLGILHSFIGLEMDARDPRVKTYGCDICGKKHVAGHRDSGRDHGYWD